MLTDEEILWTAMRQSAADINCVAEDFLAEKNIIVESVISPGARCYYSEPIACNLVSYGNNIVASVKNEYREAVAEYIDRYTFYHCFEAPNMHVLDEKMSVFSQKICFMAEYFLPDTKKLTPLPCEYKTRLLTQEDFVTLYRPEWSNALCEKRKTLDMLGVGAYDGDKLIGLAGCSADCDTMWQIGVDVLPKYRKKGIASALTSTLAVEVLNRGKVPFYCCAWSNIPSAKNAIKSGFVPSWVELTVKPTEYVTRLNNG